MNIKKLVADFLGQNDKSDLINYLEYPSDPSMGDVALPCFVLAKEYQQSPIQIAFTIAQELTLQLGETSVIQDVIAAGPYVNFIINWSVIGVDVLRTIQTQQQNYGKGVKRSDTILVESPGPNTNKPLHLGHVRNMLLGNSVTTILKFAGYNVYKVDIVNDRGIHICKSMLAYQQLGNNSEPNKKSDHFVGDRYVAYDSGLEGHPEREQQIQEMLRKREMGDDETRNLRKKMNKWCLDGHAQTYKRYGTVIDKTYLESDHYLKGKELVLDGLTQGIFRKNDKGNIVADLSNNQEKVVLRSDGTSIYMTQDIALGKVRYDDYRMDRMIYVVGNEQNDHFKALFELFSRLGYSFANQCYHLSYGMIELPDGKMKSRKGNVVDADNLIDDMHVKCFELLQERYPTLSEQELHHRAEIIAMAAIKLFVLKYDATKNFVFDRDTSLSFDGETGPYVLYTYARAKTILYRANDENGMKMEGKWNENGMKIGELSQDEKILFGMIARFEEIVQDSASNYAPAIIAKYVLNLASQFNSYYHHTKILDESVDQNITIFRLGLIASISQVLQNGLRLLGIETLEQM